MKPLPILFKAPMIRAILDGRKTQTRRTIRHPHIEEAAIFARTTSDGRNAPRNGPWWEFGIAGEGGVFAHGDYLRCPFGESGDGLWARETWGLHAHGDETDWFRGSVRGIPADSLRAQYSLALRADWGPLQEGCFWRPAIFMPRWASRITLEVTEVRVQRLQEISDDDARAEGVEPYTPPHGHISPDQRVPGSGFDNCRLGDQPHRLPFADLWDEINGKRAAWSSNPWLWAITFRRVP